MIKTVQIDYQTFAQLAEGLNDICELKNLEVITQHENKLFVRDEAPKHTAIFLCKANPVIGTIENELKNIRSYAETLFESNVKLLNRLEQATPKAVKMLVHFSFKRYPANPHNSERGRKTQIIEFENAANVTDKAIIDQIIGVHGNHYYWEIETIDLIK